MEEGDASATDVVQDLGTEGINLTAALIAVLLGFPLLSLLEFLASL